MTQTPTLKGHSVESRSATEHIRGRTLLVHNLVWRCFVLFPGPYARLATLLEEIPLKTVWWFLGFDWGATWNMSRPFCCMVSSEVVLGLAPEGQLSAGPEVVKAAEYVFLPPNPRALGWWFGLGLEFNPRFLRVVRKPPPFHLQTTNPNQ